MVSIRPQKGISISFRFVMMVSEPVGGGVCTGMGSLEQDELKIMKKNRMIQNKLSKEVETNSKEAL
jgi:hypothetical protein